MQISVHFIGQAIRANSAFCKSLYIFLHICVYHVCIILCCVVWCVSDFLRCMQYEYELRDQWHVSHSIVERRRNRDYAQYAAISIECVNYSSNLHAIHGIYVCCARKV